MLSMWGDTQLPVQLWGATGRRCHFPREGGHPLCLKRTRDSAQGSDGSGLALGALDCSSALSSLSSCRSLAAVH